MCEIKSTVYFYMMGYPKGTNPEKIKGVGFKYLWF